MRVRAEDADEGDGEDDSRGDRKGGSDDDAQLDGKGNICIYIYMYMVKVTFTVTQSWEAGTMAYNKWPPHGLGLGLGSG